jgi:DNA-binding CsgD family transcriptional regulator
MATIALLASVQGCHEDAEEMLEKCVAACLPDPEIRRNWWHTAETDVGLPAPVEFALASELLQAHRDPRAITVFARARQKFDALGNYVAASRSEAGAAVAAGLLGTAQQAREITRGYCDRARISGSPPEKSWAEFARSTALTKHGDPAEALALERASLRYQLAVGDQWTGWMVVEFRMWSLARLLTDLLAAGTCNRTRLVALATEIAHLAGGTKTLRARLGITIEAMGSFAYESDNAVAVARRVLGPGYDAAEAQGSQLRPEYNEVQRLALGTFTIDTSSNTTTRMAITQRWHELTSAERQVAVLAAAEWTNASIAARRGKSVRTIDAQIAAILHKLAITTREDIIEYIPRDTIDQVRTETLNRPTRTNRKPSLRSQPR